MVIIADLKRGSDAQYIVVDADWLDDVDEQTRDLTSLQKETVFKRYFSGKRAVLSGVVAEVSGQNDSHSFLILRVGAHLCSVRLLPPEDSKAHELQKGEAVCVDALVSDTMGPWNFLEGTIVKPC